MTCEDCHYSFEDARYKCQEVNDDGKWAEAEIFARVEYSSRASYT